MTTLHRPHVAALLAAAALGLGAAQPARAQEVYKWVDEHGVIHYGDRPQNNAARPAQLPELQTIPSERIAARPAALAAPAMSAPVGLKLLSPVADETIRGAERMFTVSAMAQGPLPPGARYVVYLDGNAVASGNEPSLTLSGIDRGSHLVAVAVHDASDRELARTDPVIVHVKPPIASEPKKPTTGTKR